MLCLYIRVNFAGPPEIYFLALPLRPCVSECTTVRFPTHEGEILTAKNTWVVCLTRTVVCFDYDVKNRSFL